MRSYLMSLISVALLGGVVGMISPEGDLKKYVRLLGTLCLLCAMVGPVFSLLQDDGLRLDGWLENLAPDDEINYEEIYNNALVEGGEKQAAEAIRTSILNSFALPEDSIEVDVEFILENDEEKRSRVQILLRDKAIFADPREIISHVESMGSCQCVIVYE